MLKIYSGLVVVTGFAMAGCLSTQYETASEDTYQTAEPDAQTRVYTRSANAAYRTVPTSYRTLNCPVGTTPHAKSGTCLLDDSSTAQSAQPVTMASVITQQRNQTRSQPQNLILANATQEASAPKAVTTRYVGANYRVRTGDTVYSLSRARCVPVVAVQMVNGLDASYTIRVGQELHLPASQC